MERCQIHEKILCSINAQLQDEKPFLCCRGLYANTCTVKTTVFGECSGVEFLVCGTHPCCVAMETFDLEVYSLHSESVFFQLHFKNYIYTPV